MTKSYKAETMREALQMIQDDLGADAIVLSAREAPVGSPWNVWKRPGVEVVAVSASDLPKIKQAAPAKSAALSDDASQIEWVKDQQPNRESGWMPRRISREEARQANLPRPDASLKTDAPPAEALEQLLAQPTAVLPGNTETPTAVAETFELPAGLAKLRRQLIAQDVDEAIVERSVQLALETQKPGVLGEEDSARKYLSRLLEAEISAFVQPALQAPRRVICLVGASGSGKTSTVAKLAVHFGKRLGKQVAWVSADTLRTGAIGEARAYTDALGLPLHLVYTPHDLPGILEGTRDADLVLIDTPGYNPYKERQMVELGELLSELPEHCTFLVTPANVKEGDLYSMSGTLSVFGLDGVIVSKLDETFTYGSVYNFARKSQFPLAYFTAGKEAIADLEVSTTQRLVAALFGKGWNKS